jgi:four helix bundle protein
MVDGRWRMVIAERKMPFRFESLKIWHMARAYATKVYVATAKFPRKEDYGLTSQMNRAVNSISLNIAEGSAKQSNQGFRYHLELAVGSTFEVVSGAFLALDRNYITKAEQHDLYEDGEQLAKSINAFRNTLD